MKIYLHCDEFWINTNFKNNLIHIATHWKGGFITNFKEHWLPASQIRSKEKVWLDRDNGEFYMIYDIADWYVHRYKLDKYSYRSDLEFQKHINMIKDKVIWKYDI